MRVFSLILGILLTASISFAADINGTWVGEYQDPFGGFGGGGAAVRTMTFSFQANGEVLNGYNVPQGMNIQVPIREGIIKGNKIWYLVDVNMGPSKMVIRYKGKLKGDKLVLSFKSISEDQAVSYGGETKVTLKRQ